ncbi:hypothetical protein F4781DRAFT_409516 [Annulohypoxylon bovei var. microspora]|nr:hypothetical protein F4781DRAFT_409516 [Annulohypoxylon bovei var. microspora]
MFLPFPILVKTKIETRKKVVLLGLFALGFFVTAIQIIRIQYIKNLSNPFNTGRLNLWSSIEINLGVIVACVPVLSPLFRQNPKSNKGIHELPRGGFELSVTKQSFNNIGQRIPSEDNLFNSARNTFNRAMNIGDREHILPIRDRRIIKKTDIVVTSNEAAMANGPNII